MVTSMSMNVNQFPFRNNMASMLNQIRRWLMQPNTWRYLCFASSVVGLLCYALSSSFNLLFGKWSMLKIFLYSIFSIFICLAILFEKTWQWSTNFKLKANLAFLVLTISSVYSYFLDKAVNGKLDAYSLISNAAFAIMSLGLSKQTHCGFAIDLLYFFCGSLILQLMKIKLLLVIVGVGFTYSLTNPCSLDGAAESLHLVRSSLGVLQVQDQDFISILIDSDSEETHSDSAIQEDSVTIMQENGDLERISHPCLVKVKFLKGVHSLSSFGNHEVKTVNDLLLHRIDSKLLPEMNWRQLTCVICEVDHITMQFLENIYGDLDFYIFINRYALTQLLASCFEAKFKYKIVPVLEKLEQRMIEDEQPITLMVSKRRQISNLEYYSGSAWDELIAFFKVEDDVVAEYLQKMLPTKKQTIHSKCD